MKNQETELRKLIKAVGIKRSRQILGEIVGPFDPTQSCGGTNEEKYQHFIGHALKKVEDYDWGEPYVRFIFDDDNYMAFHAGMCECGKSDLLILSKDKL